MEQVASGQTASAESARRNRRPFVLVVVSALVASAVGWCVQRSDGPPPAPAAQSRPQLPRRVSARATTFLLIERAQPEANGLLRAVKLSASSVLPTV